MQEHPLHCSDRTPRIRPLTSASKKSRVVFAALVVLVSVGSLVLTGCSGASSSQLAGARQSGIDAQAQKDAIQRQQDSQAALQAQIDQLQAAAKKARLARRKAAIAAQRRKAARPAPSPSPPPSPPASGETSCNGNVSVGANTTCAFAINVESAYYQSGGGYSTVDVYSPVTGLDYIMSCVPGVPVVCRGGNNAVVYIR
jgi:hypothetical protein